MTKLSLISKGPECLCEKKRYKYRKKKTLTGNRQEQKTPFSLLRTVRYFSCYSKIWTKADHWTHYSEVFFFYLDVVFSPSCQSYSSGYIFLGTVISSHTKRNGMFLSTFIYCDSWVSVDALCPSVTRQSLSSGDGSWMLSQKLRILGLVPDGGKELSQASNSCCLKMCTNCIGYALLIISSFFPTEELGFLKEKLRFKFCVYKGGHCPKQMYFNVCVSCFVT